MTLYGGRTGSDATACGVATAQRQRLSRSEARVSTMLSQWSLAYLAARRTKRRWNAGITSLREKTRFTNKYTIFARSLR